MRQLLWILPVLMIGFALAGCGSAEAGPLEGMWYEQTAERPDTISIRGNHLTYTYGFEVPEGATWDNIGYDGSFTLKEGARRREISLSKNSSLYLDDFYYDSQEDCIRTSVFVMDLGDEGAEFRRTPYTPPPEPVYGERADNSDPDAEKVIRWEDAQSIHASFFIHPNYRGYTVNTTYLPAPGRYDYAIEIKDGKAVSVTSNYCRIRGEDEPVFEDAYEDDEFYVNYFPYVPEELQNGEPASVVPDETLLQDIIDYAEYYAIEELNGYDIRTADTPPDIEDLTFTVSYGEEADGEADGFSMTANWKDITPEMATFTKQFSERLFSVFTDAGYDPSDHEFHPWISMARFGTDPEKIPAGGTYDVSLAEETKLVKVSTRFGQSTTSRYNGFVTGENVPAPFAAYLKECSSSLEKDAQAGLDAAFGRLEAGMEGYRKKKDEVIFSSHWNSIRILKNDPLLFCFSIDRGFWETFVQEGPQDVHTYYCIDPQTGQSLECRDLFTDTDRVYEILKSRFDMFTNKRYAGYFQSEAFRKQLYDKVKKGHVDMWIGAGEVQFIFPEGAFDTPDEETDFYHTEGVTYEELQGIMNPAYTSVW